MVANANSVHKQVCETFLQSKLSRLNQIQMEIISYNHDLTSFRHQPDAQLQHDGAANIHL